MDETPLDVAQRRVADGHDAETHVNAQAARVEDLARRGLDKAQAKAVLAVFETTLRIMREDLTREQERVADNQQ
jgi:hypothetical protein